MGRSSRAMRPIWGVEGDDEEEERGGEREAERKSWKKER